MTNFHEIFVLLARGGFEFIVDGGVAASAHVAPRGYGTWLDRTPTILRMFFVFAAINDIDVVCRSSSERTQHIMCAASK